MSVLLNKGSKDEKWILEKRKSCSVPATKLQVNIHKDYPKCPKSWVRKSWYSLLVVALFCTSSHVLPLFFHVLMKDPIQRYQFSPQYLKAKPAAFLTFLKEHLTFSPRVEFCCSVIFANFGIERCSLLFVWLGGKGTQPREMKIYPHPAQNKKPWHG